MRFFANLTIGENSNFNSCWKTINVTTESVTKKVKYLKGCLSTWAKVETSMMVFKSFKPSLFYGPVNFKSNPLSMLQMFFCTGWQLVLSHAALLLFLSTLQFIETPEIYFCLVCNTQ